VNRWQRGKLPALAALWLATSTAWGAASPPAGVPSRPAIRSRAEFDALARTTGTPDAVPHLLFLIDRRDRDRLYYINSRRYKFHSDFVNGAYLSLERGKAFFENNYLKPNHRFILGTIAYRAPIRRWTFEFWEGDPIPGDQIRLAWQQIDSTFFQRVAFKPNSLRQEEAAAHIPGLETVLERDIAPDAGYQPLNLARGVGRLHIVPAMNDHVQIGPEEILVLKEAPVTLPAVAGLISARPATPLSHINLLAASWGIPNAYIKDAQTRSAEESPLRFDARGGVKEVPIPGGRNVLTDTVVHRLARAALRIKRLFGGRDQDIEWAYRDGRIYIVQSRPYIRTLGS
jgi:hypothetical protein